MLAGVWPSLLGWGLAVTRLFNWSVWYILVVLKDLAVSGPHQSNARTCADEVRHAAPRAPEGERPAGSRLLGRVSRGRRC
jgi:hypothetical protein